MPGKSLNLERLNVGTLNITNRINQNGENKYLWGADTFDNHGIKTKDHIGIIVGKNDTLTDANNMTQTMCADLMINETLQIGIDTRNRAIDGQFKPTKSNTINTDIDAQPGHIIFTKGPGGHYGFFGYQQNKNGNWGWLNFGNASSNITSNVWNYKTSTNINYATTWVEDVRIGIDVSNNVPEHPLSIGNFGINCTQNLGTELIQNAKFISDTTYETLNKGYASMIRLGGGDCPEEDYANSYISFHTSDISGVEGNAKKDLDKFNTANMIIDQSGNVGIGTSSPVERLDISGNVNIVGNTKIRNKLDVSDNVNIVGNTKIRNKLDVSGLDVSNNLLVKGDFTTNRIMHNLYWDDSDANYKSMTNKKGSMIQFQNRQENGEEIIISITDTSGTGADVSINNIMIIDKSSVNIYKNNKGNPPVNPGTGKSALNIFGNLSLDGYLIIGASGENIEHGYLHQTQNGLEWKDIDGVATFLQLENTNDNNKKNIVFKDTGVRDISSVQFFVSDRVKIKKITSNATEGGSFEVEGNTFLNGNISCNASTSPAPQQQGWRNPSSGNTNFYTTFQNQLGMFKNGFDAGATGIRSTAFGTNTNASGFNTTAIGWCSVAEANFSIAIGNKAWAGDNIRFAIGSANVTPLTYETLASSGANENALEIDKDGHVTIKKNLKVDGAATFNGNVTLGDADTDTITFTGKADSALDMSNNDVQNIKDLDVDGAATFNGNVNLNGATTLIENFNQTGNKTFSTGTGAVSLNGNVKLGNEATDTITFNGKAASTLDMSNYDVQNIKDLDVSGTANFNGNVILGSNDDDTIKFNGKAASALDMNDKDVQNINDLGVDGAATFNGNVTIESFSSATCEIKLGKVFLGYQQAGYNYLKPVLHIKEREEEAALGTLQNTNRWRPNVDCNGFLHLKYSNTVAGLGNPLARDSWAGYIYSGTRTNLDDMTNQDMQDTHWEYREIDSDGPGSDTHVIRVLYTYEAEYLQVSCMAEAMIYTKMGIMFSSDKRIKTDIMDCSDNYPLKYIREIPCRYYKYIDIKKGTHTTLGFIAQEVLQIYPQAIKMTKNFIPDEYRIIKNPQWTTLIYDESENLIAEHIYDASNNKKSTEKYKLTISDLSDNSGNVPYKFYVNNDISEFENEIIVNSLQNEKKSFIFDNSWNNIFCYGKEINDFHTLDKDKLFSLNFSATKTIDKIQQEEKTKLKAAEAKIVALEAENTTLKTRLDAIESRLAALESV